MQETNLNQVEVKLGRSQLRHSNGPKEVPQQSSIGHGQTPDNPRRKPAEKAVPGAGGINLISLERRHLKRTVFTKHLATILPVRDDHATQLPHLLHVNKNGFIRGSLQKRDARQEVEEPAVSQRYVAHATVDVVEPANQSLDVDEHVVADR